jgi:hypothetical protein
VVTTESVEVTVDYAAVHALISEPGGGLAYDLDRRAEAVLQMAIRLTSGQGGGRLYMHHGLPHVAAAPHAPFDTETGTTQGSITRVLTVDGRGLAAKIGSSDPNALFQERGTSRMPAHPFLRPALAGANL